jgi:hypothetical protein
MFKGPGGRGRHGSNENKRRHGLLLLTINGGERFFDLEEFGAENM